MRDVHLLTEKLVSLYGSSAELKKRLELLNGCYDSQFLPVFVPDEGMIFLDRMSRELKCSPDIVALLIIDRFLHLSLYDGSEHFFYMFGESVKGEPKLYGKPTKEVSSDA